MNRFNLVAISFAAARSRSSRVPFAQRLRQESRGEEQKALNMAQAALRVNKTWADVAVLKQNLWGTRLVADAQKLLSHPSVQAVR